MGPFQLTDQAKQALYTGWTDQNSINQDWAQNGAQKYAGYIANGGAPLSNEPGAVSIANTETQKQAQYKYQQGVGSAVSGLQTAGTNLDSQYSDLLTKTLGLGTVALNTITSGENNLLASRGITPNSPLYSKEMGLAQLPVSAQNQAAVGSLGYTQAGLKLGLAGSIAGLQAGGAGTAMGIPLQYGSLALSQGIQPSQVAYNVGQAKQAETGARYITIPGVGVVDLNTGNFVGGITNNNLNSGGYQITQVHG